MFKSELTYQKTITMITEICCNCGVAFGMPSDLRKSFLKDSDKLFYCPNGHSQRYTESIESKLKRDLEFQKNKAKVELEAANNRHLYEFNKRLKIEKQLKRVHAGKCPCCKRNFENVANNMKIKHPEFTQNSTLIVNKK